MNRAGDKVSNASGRIRLLSPRWHILGQEALAGACAVLAVKIGRTTVDKYAGGSAAEKDGFSTGSSPRDR